MASRKLHTMYVCDGCNGLFADGEALDRHKLICLTAETQDYYVDSLVRSWNSSSKVLNYVLLAC